MSFNDEGFLGRAELEQMLAPRGAVQVYAVDYQRYVGAKIGIYNPSGAKVGRVGRTRNREMLYLAGPPSKLARLPELLAETSPQLSALSH